MKKILLGILVISVALFRPYKLDDNKFIKT